ncbi:hypothetical protein jhhlp_008337 [Lomentospora prolificans]|uniref:DUF6594 domain-containing protein n=1 Tax=Lomentospora prolificans TaxID=41688 RepID=A0A2N3MXR2_9PEZI|nr:hypothetical protein jhhlp_008337 [Lomentospora prolificans]
MPRDSSPQLAADAARVPLPDTTADESISNNAEFEPQAAMNAEPELALGPEADVAASGDCHMSEHQSSKNTGGVEVSGHTNIEDSFESSPKYAASPKTTAAVKHEVMDESPCHQTSQTNEQEQSASSDDKINRSPSPSASTLTNCSSITSKTNGSGSSSDSGSTITQSSYSRHEQADDMEIKDERRSHRSSHSSSRSQSRGRPNALNFLEPDSPAVTAEAIRRSIEESTARWRASGSGNRKSPSTQSSTSSESSSMRSDVFSIGDHETDRSSSPENSVDGDSSGSPSSNVRTQFATDPRKSHPTKSYGTPEMPRGKANLPHIPPKELQPRLGTQYGYVKHLPRAEKLPLSGYQLLASKLSPSHARPSIIQPMYRRFETMNHRILLHLQDELAEMEEQLHRLDTADTQTRRLQNCILPASRRSDYLAGGELQWHKTDILGKIGYKLEQYNRVLSSFEKTQNMSAPSKSEIEDYRGFLEAQRPITELETRFLDCNDDLVAIGRPRSRSFDRSECLSSGAPTPMPQLSADQQFGELLEHDAPSNKDTEAVKRLEAAPPIAVAPLNSNMEVSIPSLAAGLAISVLLPIAAFPTIPGLLGRILVVCLVAIGVLNPLLQAGSLKGLGIDTRNALICAAIYGGAMSVVATVIA